MRFKYANNREKFLPILLVELRGKKWVILRGFLDPWATYSIFHADFARTWGIKVEGGERTYVKVGDESFIPVCLHRLNLKFGDEAFNTVIGFSKRPVSNS